MNSTNRNSALDSIKGVLVVVMVIYHAMNIFSTAGAAAFAPIRFVSGSFVFISGYIIAVFYERKYQSDAIQTSKRLWIRGLKLLVIFNALNLMINVTGIGNPEKVQLGLQQYANNLLRVHGPGDTRHASFQILLPIAYVLLASPFFLLVRKFAWFFLVVSLVTAFCLSIWGIETINSQFVVIGAVGLSVGIVVNSSKWVLFLRNRFAILGLLIVCGYLMESFGANSMTYAIGTMAIIKLIYDFNSTIVSNNWVSRSVALLGQYSLVCYIAQIGFLQGLSWLLGRQKWELGYEVLAIVVVTNLVLLVACVALTFFRERYLAVASSYRLIFS